MSSCSATPKEQKFGIKVCRERKCIELQRDPKWPDSAERCMVFDSMPGAMRACVKELDPDLFMRQAGFHFAGQVYNNNAPNPGVRNCPKTCPYKIFVDGEKFVWEEGKSQGTKVPAKIGTCAFTGRPFGEYGGCGCNVLGNDKQDEQIKLLTTIIKVRREMPWDELRTNCKLQPCPDGVQRCKGGTDCPVIRIPFADLKECPLWRIPAKLLPAGQAMTKEEMQEAHDRVTREAIEKESLPGGVLYQEKEEEYQKSTKKVLKKYSEKPAEKKPKQGPRPSLNRCPDPCPYKTTVLEDHGKEKNYPQGRCAFTGQKLREMEKCPCGVLDEMDERTLEYLLKQIRNALQAHAEESFSVKLCHDHRCPDGQVHCGIGDDKQAWVCDAEEGHPPLASLHRCYLARFIPAPDPIVEKKTPISADLPRVNNTKVESPSRKKAPKKKPKLSEYRCDTCPIWEYDDKGACREYLSFPVDERPVVFRAIEILGCGHHPALLKQLLKIHEKNPHREVIREAGTRQRQLIEFDEPVDIGPCKDCSIECPSETDGCEAFHQYVEKECQEPDDPTKEARTVELSSICFDCPALDKCKSHDPHAGCMNELAETVAPGYPTSIGGPLCKTCGWPEAPAPGKERSCITCGHHKGRKTFAETCPRKGELLFLGGTKSAAQLMTETATEGCKDAIPKPDPRCTSCRSFDGCQTHDPEKQNCVAKALIKPGKKDPREKFNEAHEANVAATVHQCSECGKMCNNAFIPGKLCKPAKKPRARKQKEQESHDPLRKFLNEHYVEIISGENLPIVPPGLVKDMYERESKTVTTTRPMKLYLIATTHGDRFGLSPSGRISRILIPSGELHRGHGGPDCRFTFEWRFTSKAKKEENP